MQANSLNHGNPISEESYQVFRDVMVDYSPCITLVFSEALDLVECNATAVEYFGFSTAAELQNNIKKIIDECVPVFQPDASPTIPLLTRVEYVLKNGTHDFEMEILLNDSRVPLRIMMNKVELGDSYVIACFAFDTQALKEARNELLRHEFLMRQVNSAATRLLSAEPEKFDSSIKATIKSLTQSVGACQMAILENYGRDGGTGCRLLYNWDSSGTTFLLHQEDNCYAIDYANVPDWYEALVSNNRINDSGTKLAAMGRENYFPRGTKAFMIIPVFLQKVFWGIIVTAKSNDDRRFSNAEERAIQSGGILIVTAILRNQINQNLITAREAAMASEQAKSDFLSRMSHEIRTPLNAILGMTAIAQKSADTEYIKSCLKKVETASEQLLSLVNDILDMSKIENGKLEAVYHPFDFAHTLDKTIEIQKVRMQEKNQTFRLECEKPFNRYMVSDELRLSQVLINLLGNAVKFTSEGGNISLLVDYFEAEEEGEYVLHVEVRDDGIGISQKQQQRLFQNFEQADGSISRRFGGTGLGLAICKNIVQLLGGSIRAESSEGLGSTFVFDIRFTWGDPIGFREENKDGQHKAAFSWEGKQILLAEDIEINREIIIALLEDTGARLTCAENGLKALSLFKEKGDAFSLVLMDVHMPEMDGLEATRQIRALDGEWAKAVPILAMTANAFSGDVQQCLNAGMTEHISKPVDVGILMATLSKYLD